MRKKKRGGWLTEEAKALLSIVFTLVMWVIFAAQVAETLSR